MLSWLVAHDVASAIVRLGPGRLLGGKATIMAAGVWGSFIAMLDAVMVAGRVWTLILGGAATSFLGIASPASLWTCTTRGFAVDRDGMGNEKLKDDGL